MRETLVLRRYDLTPGTAVFLALDYGLGINVRLAFLEAHPGLKAAYYGICFACLAAVLLRPEWTLLIGAVESFVWTLSPVRKSGRGVTSRATCRSFLSARRR